SGRSIQALGIEPDILVEERAVTELTEAERQARSEADLRGSLVNELTEDEQNQLEAERTRHEKTAELRAEDFQLAYALDLLAGMATYDVVANRKGEAGAGARRRPPATRPHAPHRSRHHRASLPPLRRAGAAEPRRAGLRRPAPRQPG